MKRFLFSLSIIFLTQSSFAQFDNFDKIYNITDVTEPTYLCQFEGPLKKGGYAIKATKPFRVWSITFNEGKMSKNGMELFKLDLTTYKCPHCYSFTGELGQGELGATINAKMTTENGKIILASTMSSPIADKSDDQDSDKSKPQTHNLTGTCQLIPSN